MTTLETIQELDIDTLRSDNIRDRIDEQAIQGLAESIQAVGQLYPVRVYRDGEGFIIIDGHRRAQAKRLIGHRTIFAIVESPGQQAAASIQKALIANAQREGLTPLASARAMARLMQETGWSAAETAAKLGFPQSKVTKLLAFLKLPHDLAEELSDKGAGASIAYQLARIEDPQKQAQMAQRFLGGQLTRDGLNGAVRQERAERRIAEGSGKPRKAIVPRRTSRVVAPMGSGRSVTLSGIEASLDAFIACLEETLARARKARGQGLSLATFTKLLRDTTSSKGGTP